MANACLSERQPIQAEIAADYLDEQSSLHRRPDKIGVLGGTFNPPHLGHLLMADIAYHEFSLSKVIVLPVGTPPHKREDSVLDREVRRAMAELFIAERAFLRLCTVELDRQGNTYTIDTIAQLKKHRQDRQLLYLIGSDTLLELETWRNYRQVFREIEFICILRPGDSVERVLAYSDYLRLNFGARISIAERSGIDVSSSIIRDRMAAGQSVMHLVPTSVLLFMERNHVFG